jgi:glycosyltransferase involved in cell wall biosynthesis
LIVRKGVETLVQAIGRIAATNPEEDISLILVGDGEEKLHILRSVAELGLLEKIHSVGWVSDAELAHLYETSDVLVLPSLSEGCPTVVLEAMYYGLPVIASDIPGIRDHFKETAWLVPPQDELVLASAILALAKKRDLLDWMRTIGRELVLKQYTWDRIARDYQSIYQRASSSTRGLKHWSPGARKEPELIIEGSRG